MSKTGRSMVRVDPQRRARLIDEFERSEMTAVAFARRHRINYTTFCGWLHRHRRQGDQPAFVEVEVQGQPNGGGLVIELGSQARVRLEEEAQVPLVARLIKACNSTGAC